MKAVSSPEYARDALRLLARTWPAESAQSASLIGDLARSEAPHAVEDAATASLASAAGDVIVRGWRRHEVARMARKAKAIDADTQSLILDALGSSGLWPMAWPESPVERCRRVRAVAAALAFLYDLPPLPDLSDGGEQPADPEQARMLDKVRALLAKAESTEFDEEAEALTAKAQELMARYAIDQATVEADTGASRKVGSTRVGIDDPYSTAKALLLQHIAGANRCRSMWTETYGFSTVFGTDSDLRLVETLFTSLLVQAVAAMRRAGSHVDAIGRSRTRSFRQSFLVAFAGRIGERLQDANRVAEARAVDDIGDSFLPVLASRAQAADRACSATFPQSKPKQVSSINAAGEWAGRVAADMAQIQAGAPLDAFRSA